METPTDHEWDRQTACLLQADRCHCNLYSYHTSLEITLGLAGPTTLTAWGPMHEDTSLPTGIYFTYCNWPQIHFTGWGLLDWETVTVRYRLTTCAQTETVCTIHEDNIRFSFTVTASMCDRWRKTSSGNARSHAWRRNWVSTDTTPTQALPHRYRR